VLLTNEKLCASFLFVPIGNLWGFAVVPKNNATGIVKKGKVTLSPFGNLFSNS
jgi:hypothetical protein